MQLQRRAGWAGNSGWRRASDVASEHAHCWQGDPSCGQFTIPRLLLGSFVLAFCCCFVFVFNFCFVWNGVFLYNPIWPWTPVVILPLSPKCPDYKTVQIIFFIFFLIFLAILKWWYFKTGPTVKKQNPQIKWPHTDFQRNHFFPQSQTLYMTQQTCMSRWLLNTWGFTLATNCILMHMIDWDLNTALHHLSQDVVIYYMSTL